MIEYWGIKEFAAHHGLPAATVRRYKFDGRLPAPDAVIGTGDNAHHGWLPDTAKNWTRPGQGARTDLRRHPGVPGLSADEALANLAENAAAIRDHANREQQGE